MGTKTILQCLKMRPRVRTFASAISHSVNIVGSYDIPQSAIKNHSRVPISEEQKVEIVCRVRIHLKAILSNQSIQEFVLK